MEHDEQTLLLDDYPHVEEEPVKYGYKDPSLDLLHRSYFHIWGKKYLVDKWYTRNVVTLNRFRYPKDTSTESITESDHPVRMSGLTSIGRFRNMVTV